MLKYMQVNTIGQNMVTIFILAGGFGTRLKTVVSNVPKPMAPILDKPFLKYQINEIKLFFPNNKIYLLTYYLSEIIEDYFQHNESIIILKEEEPFGTGGSIKNAINKLQLSENESILVFNGDTYIKPNLTKMINSTKSDISILGCLQDNCDRYGTLTIKDNKITAFNEKKIGVKKSYINGGCYYFKNLNFFKDLHKEKFAIEEQFAEYMSHNEIDIYRYDDIFIDIGIPEYYYKMVNYIKEANNGN